jgi:hypothetical protein
MNVGVHDASAVTTSVPAVSLLLLIDVHVPTGATWSVLAEQVLCVFVSIAPEQLPSMGLHSQGAQPRLSSVPV